MRILQGSNFRGRRFEARSLSVLGSYMYSIIVMHPSTSVHVPTCTCIYYNLVSVLTYSKFDGLYRCDASFAVSFIRSRFQYRSGTILDFTSQIPSR